MSVVLSVDPGTRCSGAAFWCSGQLFAAGAIVNPMKTGSGPRECAAAAAAIQHWQQQQECWRVTVLVAELPQVYQRGANKTVGDPNVCVLPLAMIDAALAALYPDVEVHTYQPHSWKGNTTKPDKVDEPYVIEGRVRARLTPAETKVLERNWPRNVSHSWDLIDAVAVGLHHLGRFERHRILARE